MFRLKFKLWRRDLARFILENNFKTGVEVGVKACKSYRTCLKLNPELTLIGIDTWEVLPNSPYAKNDKYEIKCKKISKAFGKRAILIKGDAATIAEKFPDESFDFVFYDLFNYRVSKVSLHETVLKAWFPKLKENGKMVGRDFFEPDISQALRNLGYSFDYCKIGQYVSPRLAYSYPLGGKPRSPSSK